MIDGCTTSIWSAFDRFTNVHAVENAPSGDGADLFIATLFIRLTDIGSTGAIRVSGNSRVSS